MRKFLIGAVGRLGVLLFDTLLFTCRMEREGEKEVAPFLRRGPYLLASWHGRLIVYFFGPRKDWPAAMASRSKDGEIAASLQSKGRYRVFRGSTRKGGSAALMQMEAYMRKYNRSGMLSVDGPTGPRFEAKTGAAKLAANLGYTMIPVSFSAEKALILKSWDRLMIPKPFSRCLLIYGKPIHVPLNASDQALQRATSALQDELIRITKKADDRFGIRLTP